MVLACYWPILAGSGWFWVVVAGSWVVAGGSWLVAGGCGWLQLVAAGCGWLRPVAASYLFYKHPHDRY